MPTTTRGRLHELLDALPEDRLTDADVALTALADPILVAFLNAPEDDEPLTDADRAAIAEGRADVARGDVVAWDDYDPGRGADR